jgi:uncharacterized protein with beta-barrel porin domain
MSGGAVSASPGRLGVLLASSSIAALLVSGSGPAMAACTNTIGPGASASFTNPNGTIIPCVQFQGATISGNVVNAGTISPGGPDGMIFTNSGGNGTTILGAVSNAGKISVAGTGILVGAGGGAATLLGGITNTGTITATGGVARGVFVEGQATFNGGITNAGAISSAGAGIDVVQVSQFSGGITNAGAGTITTANTGILVLGAASVLTFGGNISNAGTITGSQGILVKGTTSGTLFHFRDLTGAVINSGTIAAANTGITVQGVSTFIGGVTNTGKIVATAGAGILVNGLFSTGGANPAGSTYSGGIVSSGTIQAGTIGIELTAVSNFSGGITSSSISAGATAISVTHVSVFSGGITTSGTIEGTNGVLIDPTTVRTINGDIVNNGTIIATAGDGIAFNPSGLVFATFNGNVTNNGTVTATGGTAIVIDAVFNNGGLVNNGVLSSSNKFGFAAIGNDFGSSSLGIVNASTGTINGGGLAAVFIDAGTFTGGFTNNGTITAANGDGVLATGLGVSTYSGGFTNTGTITAKIGVNVDTQTFNGLIVNSGNITGTGGTAVEIGGLTNAVTFDQEAGTITGALILESGVSGDVLNISGGVVNGNISDANSTGTLNFNLGSGTFTYGSAFHFSGMTNVNVNSGTVILDGSANTATSTTVNGGTLVVGDAANPGATLVTNTVAVNGGTLAGDDTIDPGGTVVTINSGGTLAPGAPGSIGTLTIGGSLTINSGSFYDVLLNDTVASKTLVNSAPGTATINGGTVVVTPQYTTLGAHGGTTFTILTATGGRTGTFSAVTSNVSNFTGSFSLSYDADDVFLNVGKGFELLPSLSGATVNERDVFNGINNAILAGDTVPNGFNQLLRLSGAAYLNALNQLDGEGATGAERGAFDLMNEFLGLMLDPFVDGRGGSSTSGGTLGFAPDQQAQFPPDLALAYAGLLKAPAPQTFAQRWSAWAAGFGGSATANGDPVVGSSNVTTSTYGYAAGLDYHYSPDTVFGFSLAGGGTNWNLANALGTGRSDALLAGIYGVTHQGPWYLGGALAFANNWFTTNRTALGDQLTASFQGQSYSARLEGGYRFALPVYHDAVGVTPYAAVQVQDFQTPAFSETDLSGGGLGLSFNAMNGTDTRSELGSRFDDLTAINNLPLVLRAKVAWAHDWVSNPALNASFESLPGSGFTVFGAAIPRDSALTSTGAQLFFTPNWSLLAKFDGEFASGYQLYAGSGTLRYTW